MNNQTLTEINALKEYFEEVNQKTTNGDGNTIEDVAHSFKWINDYAQRNGLTDSVFGEALANQSTQVVNILAQLETCYSNLALSIDTFVNEQTAANNGN